MPELSIFAQELYLEESLQAIESYGDIERLDGLAAEIAKNLPHKSAKTRQRIATKIVQRFFKTIDGQSPASAFLRLVRELKVDSAQKDLLYWRTARTDILITKLARDIFYPYFILNEMPLGYDEASFQMANMGTLFSLDKIVTRDFAVLYAQKRWSFESARTVTLALRIMRQAGILDAIFVKLGRRHILGYHLQSHVLLPEIFAYCLFEELFENAPNLPPMDRVHNATSVKLFFLTKPQTDSLLKILEKRRVISYTVQAGNRRLTFIPQNAHQLVSVLLE